MIDNLQPTIIRASAGTGKTYQLTARLLKILLQGAAPESILATTFTRKAAGEILARLMLDLAKAADPDQPESLAQLRRQVGIETLPRTTVAELLVTVVRSIHRLQVCTLDSLFSKLARSFAFELDLPPGWRLSDEIEELNFRSTAVNALIGRLDPTETSTLLAMLSKGDKKRSVAREVIEVIAGNYSLSRGADHQGWRTLTAPKSPIQHDDQWDAAAGELIDAASATTVKRHATKLKALADLITNRNFEKLLADGLISKIGLVSANEMPIFHQKPFESSVKNAFDLIYSFAKTERLGLLVGQNDATGRVLQTYSEEIEAIKRESAALSFEDVSIRLAKSFGEIEPSLLQSRMDGSVDHLLLDEFQDTSPVQWSVLRSMAIHASTLPSNSTGGGSSPSWQVPRSFFCVGDTKQAIYGWRGGVAEIFDAVADQIPGLDQRTQDTSFRSSPIITDVVTDTFRSLENHPIVDAQSHPASADHYEAVAVRTFARRFPKHKTARDRLPGYFEFSTAQTVDGDAPTRQSAVLDCVAQRVDTLVNQINDRSPLDPDADQKTIGILTRTNAAIGEMIQRLSALGVDVSQEGGNPLTDSSSVQMILSALLMAEHPGDGRWAFHLSQTPLGVQHGWTGDKIRRMVADIGLVQTITQLGSCLAPVSREHDTLRLKQLVQLAIAYSNRPGPRLRNFVDLVYQKRIARPREASVRVMTIHQSKGLEFDAVFLPQISGELVRPSTDPVADVPDLIGRPAGFSRSLPKSDWHFLSPRWRVAFGNHAASKMTEALCLMYVAMTRAKQSLYMIAEPHAKMTEKKTVAGLVSASLRCENVGDGGTVLHRRGDDDWFAQQ